MLERIYLKQAKRYFPNWYPALPNPRHHVQLKGGVSCHILDCTKCWSLSGLPWLWLTAYRTEYRLTIMMQSFIKAIPEKLRKKIHSSLHFPFVWFSWEDARTSVQLLLLKSSLSTRPLTQEKSSLNSTVVGEKLVAHHLYLSTAPVQMKTSSLCLRDFL